LAKAVAYFRQCAKDFPQSVWSERSNAWIESLKEMDKLRRVSADAAQENDRLRKASAEVVQENQKLKHIVEQSRMVDIEIDEKKRSHAK
jgi:hypothetical protein